MKEYIRPELDVINFQTESICGTGTTSGEYWEEPDE